MLSLLTLATPDAPYVEIVPDRYTFNDQPAVYNWGTVPAPCCVAQAVPASDDVLLLMDSGGLLLASSHKAGGRSFTRVAVEGGSVLAGSRLALTLGGVPMALVHAGGHAALECTLQNATCVMGAAIEQAFGGPVAGAALLGSPPALFVGAGRGLFRCPSISGGAPCARLLGGDATEAPVTALAAHGGTVAAGSADKLWLLSADGALLGWEWTTVIDVDSPAFASGGVLDGPVTSLAFEGASGDLWAGNDVALNIRQASSGLWSRLSGDAGLPHANVTAIVPEGSVVDPVSGAKQLWVGTARGLAMRSAAADPPWRYLYGPRWHPGRHVTALAAAGRATMFAATDEGVAFFDQQVWTLERKAAAMQSTLARHDRHGMVAGCALPSFGNTSRTLCVDDDNNGLWTAVVVVAEYLRYAATGDLAAAASAAHFLAGLQLLHDITGVEGLYARSACAPGDTGCAPDRATLRRPCNATVAPGCCSTPGAAACGLQWRNSTVAAYEGWIWKSDASSDETVGHFFAFAIAAALAPTAAERAAAAETVAAMTDYMVAHAYTLVDWNGFSTSWGRWSPTYVNGWRAFSDGRGLQSLQMLAFLAAARNASEALPDDAARAAGRARWEAAYRELTNATNAFGTNLLNAKIASPVDDNFSDDQLTFMPYYSLLVTGTDDAARRAPALASLERTWRISRSGRSDLWAAIYMAATGTAPEADVESMLWTLRAWPLELINWNTSNDQRVDLDYQRDACGARRANCTFTSRVLPANERSQYMWNADPFDTRSVQIWNNEPARRHPGMNEEDPGAWLLPFWLARFHGLVERARGRDG